MTAEALPALFGITSAFGSVATGIASREEAGSEAEIERINARTEAEATREQAEQTAKRQKLQFTAGGIDISGSPLMLLTQTRLAGAAGAAKIQTAGEFTAKSIERKGKSSMLASIAQAPRIGIETFTKAQSAFGKPKTTTKGK